MISQPRISVIMPVRLQVYEGQTANPQLKFIRAVESFLNQVYINCELVIISDGCSLTNEIVSKKYKQHLKSGIIKLIKRERSELFTGDVRQQGIDMASGSILCNLDADDTIESYHLNNISKTFDLKFEWVYFNLYRKLDVLNGVEEIVDTQMNTNSLCTASVAWRKDLDVSWNGANGRMDNKIFNQRLIDGFKKVKKIYGMGYCIRHANLSYAGS